jgi:hypothetical protein
MGLAPEPRTPAQRAFNDAVAALNLPIPLAPVENGRVHFEGGGLREPQDGKARYDLMLPVGVPLEHQFLTRVARHLGESLRKYPERNWEQFSDQAALNRAKASAFRHFLAWMTDEDDEDHAAAVFFNLMAAEHVRAKMEGKIDE